VLGGKGRAIIRSAAGREDDVTGVGEASDGGPRPIPPDAPVIMMTLTTTPSQAWRG
jgi:hypothetical protein